MSKHSLTSVAALSPSSAPSDRLLQIAGLVNSYHNDGTTRSAAETLKAIADVLGDPFASSAPSVIREPEAPSCEKHGVMVADDEMGRGWHCAVCPAVLREPPSGTGDAS
jgi:hypothetical protein